MRYGQDEIMKDRGITLIELIIVISIIGILLIALGFSFEGWMGAYRVESQTKEMFVDLMNARARAMERNRMHFVDLTTTQYTIYEDTNTAPDGNGIPEPASDTRILQKNLDPSHPITWSNIADTEIEFTDRGLSNDSKTVCVNIDLIEADPSPSGADYDCIIISPTRINLGQLQKSIPDGGTCASSTSGGDCVAK
jgi:prepilin-type N-terminal cleavage/methylation domain-containing protein